MTTRTFTVTVTRGPIIGDVDMDGSVGIADITSLIDMVLGSVLAIYDPVAADVDCDNQITIADVTSLIDMVLTGH